MKPCTDCGYDWDVPAGGISSHIANWADRYRRIASDDEGRILPTDVLVTRPSSDVWSALEYLAHMRDIADFYGDRLHRVLTEERPVLAVGFRFAQLAELRSYRAENPVTVLASFEEKTRAIMREIEGIERDQWTRIGIGSDGDQRTLLTLARRFAHEVQHHLLDVECSLDAVS